MAMVGIREASGIILRVDIEAGGRLFRVNVGMAGLAVFCGLAWIVIV